MKRRSRLEIIYSILKIIRDSSNSIKKTPLNRKTNLSTTNFSEYYIELKQKELVREEVDKKGKTYISLTDNGFKYLQKYETIKEFIKEFEL